MTTRLIRQFSPAWAHRSANPFIYLACPYTSPEPETRQTRVEVASVVAAQLALAGKAVYSPITHGHPMAQHLPSCLGTDHDFWMQHCLPILAAADELWVLPLRGWDSSRGLAEEWAFAQDHGIPVKVIDRLPAPWGNYLAVEPPKKDCEHVGWYDAGTLPVFSWRAAQ